MCFYETLKPERIAALFGFGVVCILSFLKWTFVEANQVMSFDDDIVQNAFLPAIAAALMFVLPQGETLSGVGDAREK